jgi:hypothetical protein
MINTLANNSGSAKGSHRQKEPVTERKGKERKGSERWRCHKQCKWKGEQMEVMKGQSGNSKELVLKVDRLIIIDYDGI